MMMNELTLALFTGVPGAPELLILAVIVLLFFGNRVPSVMRSLGQSIVEFKRGVKGIENDIETESQPGSSDRNA